MTVDELRRYQDKTAILRLQDGEVATVKVLWVDAEYEDIIVDIVQSNRECKGPAGSAYTIRIADITSVDPVPQ